jgi:hypothetical protein
MHFLCWNLPLRTLVIRVEISKICFVKMVCRILLLRSLIWWILLLFQKLLLPPYSTSHSGVVLVNWRKIFLRPRNSMTNYCILGFYTLLVVNQIVKILFPLILNYIIWATIYLLLLTLIKLIATSDRRCGSDPTTSNYRPFCYN